MVGLWEGAELLGFGELGPTQAFSYILSLCLLSPQLQHNGRTQDISEMLQIFRETN